MTTHATTNHILTDRTEPPRPAPLLRGVAQQATGLSAGFDLILRTQLDAADREPGVRPDPVEKAQPRPREDAADQAVGREAADQETPVDQSGPADEPDAEVSEDSASEPRAGSGEPADGRDDTDSAERAETTTATDVTPGETAETQALDARDPSAVEKPQASDEVEAERRFIAEHGKRAAQLRWDSVGVELTHAAEINLADRSAQKLVTRGEVPSPLARAAAQDAPSLTTPANAADSGKGPENKGQSPVPQPDRAPPQSASQTTDRTEPTAKATPNTVPTSDASAALAAPASAARVSSTVASVATVGTSPERTESRTGTSASSGRGDLIARLGSINGQSAVGVTTKATTNAIEGITRAMLRTERAGKPQAAAPAPRGEKNETIRQVQQGLAKLIKSSGGKSTVRLTPRALGEVTVRLDIREGVASARFSASSDVARSLLKSGLKELQAALETRGIRVERLSVDSENVRTPTESARHEARAEPQAPRTGEHSPGSTVSDRPEADTGSRGGHPGFAGHHRGQGRRDDSTVEASTRSVEASGAEPLPLLEPAGRDEGWIRLDTVA